MSHLGCEALQWLPLWHILHPRKSGMGHSWTDSGMRRERTSYKQMAQGLGETRDCFLSFFFFLCSYLKALNKGMAKCPFLWDYYPLGSTYFHTPLYSFTLGLHASQPTYSSRGWVGSPWHTYPLSCPWDKRRGRLKTTFSSNCPALQDLVQVLPQE